MPSKNVDKIRNLSGLLPPSTRLNIIDYGKMAEQDNFYLACQKHRDYYRDKSGLLHPVAAFEPATKKYADPPSPTSVYLKQPVRYHTEMRPCNYPQTTARCGGAQNYSYEIRMKGTYSVFPCKCYKK